MIHLKNNSEIEKFSSVQGLSGETTSSIYYSVDYDRLVIGYENGLIEIIDGNGSISNSNRKKERIRRKKERINRIHFELHHRLTLGNDIEHNF